MKNNTKFLNMSKKLYKGNMRYLAGFILLISVISVLMAIMDPIILRIVFDALESGDSRKVFMVCLEASIITVGFLILCYIQNCYCDIWLYRLVGNGNSKSFIKYHSLPYGEKISRHDEGDAFNRISTGVEGLAYVWLFLSLIVSGVLSSIFISALAVTTSVWIIVLAVMLFLFTFIRASYESKRNMTFSTEQQELGGIRESSIYALIHNMEFLAMTGTEDILREQYTKARNRIWDVEKRRTYLAVWLDAVEEAVRGTFRGLLSFFVFQLKSTETISTGQVVSSFSIYDSLYTNLCFLRRPITAMPQQFVPVQRLDEILSLQRENACGKPAPEKTPVISMKNVSLKLGDREVLKNVSFEIFKGQKIALVGQNGCGKSTLLRVILGLYAPEAGSSAVMGNASACMAYSDIRALISFIPSRSQLFSQSSRWNIETGADDEEINNVDDIAKTLMIQENADDFLDKNTGELSGGQAQRVNIARAMVHKTPIILADEPAASLDNQMGLQVVKKIVSSAETVVVVTHNPSHIKYFDRVIVMEGGMVAANISASELKDNDSYNKWLGNLETIMV